MCVLDSLVLGSSVWMSSDFPMSNSSHMFIGLFSPKEATRNPVLSVGLRTTRINECPFVVQFLRTNWQVENENVHIPSIITVLVTSPPVELLAVLPYHSRINWDHLREMRNLTYGPTVKAEGLMHCFNNGSRRLQAYWIHDILIMGFVFPRCLILS
jgi:hypothetical protein